MPPAPSPGRVGVPLAWRAFGLAGLCTGLLGLFTPQILGVSYDTVTTLLEGRLGMLALVGIVSFKLIATTVSIGVGIPGGLIGPTLVIGGACGALAGQLAGLLDTADVGSTAFYAMVGMTAMMGATLRAPLAALAALVALLEMTTDPLVILPGMVAVAGAEGVAWLVVGTDSVFTRLLSARRRLPAGSG